MKLTGNDPNQPNFARPEYFAREEDLALIADEMGGTRSMWARSTKYIRRWSAEKIGNYNIRRQCETFFEGFGRTLSAAVGMLFAQSPDLKWNQSEELMTEQWDNIDGAGANGPVFVKRFAEAALRDGLSLILVDHPSPPPGQATGDGGVVTAKDVERLGLRPFWRRYDRLQIINWLVEIVDNQATLTQMTLIESGTERVGQYGTRNVVRYRDLRLGTLTTSQGSSRVATWKLRQLNDSSVAGAGTFDDKGSGTFRDKDGNSRATLPIAIGYTGRTDAPMEATIPLLGVAWANLAHWQLSTSLRFNSEIAGFAQPTVVGALVNNNPAGVPATGLEIGPLVSVNVEQGGDFKWVEAAGTGLERLAMLVLEKLKQMAALGVSFLMSDTRAAETAEAKRLDAAAENATLATAATGIQDAVNLALEIHAWYLGIEKVGAPVLTISHDFESTVMPADVMQAYIAAMKEGLPPRVLLEAFQAGGRIGPDVNLDDLEAEIMGNIAAAEKQKQLQLEAMTANNAANAQGGNGNAPPPKPAKAALPKVPA